MLSILSIPRWRRYMDEVGYGEDRKEAEGEDGPSFGQR
jgi:hypothetical protein